MAEIHEEDDGKNYAGELANLLGTSLKLDTQVQTTEAHMARVRAALEQIIRRIGAYNETIKSLPDEDKEKLELLRKRLKEIGVDYENALAAVSEDTTKQLKTLMVEIEDVLGI